MQQRMVPQAESLCDKFIQTTPMFLPTTGWLKMRLSFKHSYFPHLGVCCLMLHFFFYEKRWDRPSLQAFLSLCSCGLPHCSSISPVVYNYMLFCSMWQTLCATGSPVILLQQDVVFEMENLPW